MEIKETFNLKKLDDLKERIDRREAELSPREIKSLICNLRDAMVEKARRAMIVQQFLRSDEFACDKKLERLESVFKKWRNESCAELGLDFLIKEEPDHAECPADETV